eukprot:TRINITY_DN32007_c0_g1_i1.p1 TRINITY_DN32007_c0_g1~~TRINITY_DN32007_c0_g1_i1.p1  ORF type:complete len:355 (+),score=26.42 TRINITY_DN32007_c0_g1_i1:40-1065(+)
MGFPETIFVDHDSIPNRLVCTICLEVVCDAVFHLECQNGFCHTCLASVRNCPLCRLPLSVRNVIPDRTRNDLVGDLQVYCRYRKGVGTFPGCFWSGPLRGLKQHETTQCEFNFVMCSGCNQQVLVKDLDQHHRVDCALRLVACPYCNQEFPATSRHFARCTEIPTRCPNHLLGCEEVLPRKLVRHHTTSECVYSFMPCLYARQGCPAQVMRSKLQEHMRSCTYKAEAEAAREIVAANERRARQLLEEVAREKTQMCEASPAYHRPQKCRRCKKQFTPSQNTKTCALHEGKPRYEKRPTKIPLWCRKETVWPCCGKFGAKAPGCTVELHVPSKPILTTSKSR